MKLVYQAQDDWEVFHFKGASTDACEDIARWCGDHFEPENEWLAMTPVFESLSGRFLRTGSSMREPEKGDFLVLVKDPGDAMLLRLHWAQLTREPYR